ncbi:MAG: DUF1934 domain-containing protein [Clostridia bacterium]|nr:DUF1934 domain-containing protein [Clostridia bacterium]
MPISEYSKDEKELSPGETAIIKIHSTQRDMTGTGFFGEAVLRGDSPEEILEAAEQRSAEAENGVYIFTTEGNYITGDRFSVSYNEDELSRDGICQTEISFSKCSPKCVTITRSGTLSSSFIIEEGKRQYSVYKTPYGALEMCVYARRVDNRLTENGGLLILDYAVELKGMTAQRTKMRVDVKVKNENEA